MRRILLLIFLGTMLFSCASNNTDEFVLEEMARIDTLRIANDSLNYELVFVEPGIKFWLENAAEPREKLSEEFLKEMNLKMIDTYNFRCKDKILYSDLYVQPIRYEEHIDYGYEVNYLLYNYLVFFQKRYAQNL